jgi:hypothetical protein
MGWGGFLDKLLGILPIQKRIERWKNELENIQKERSSLLAGDADKKKAKRVADIENRIVYLTQLLKNNAHDN